MQIAPLPAARYDKRDCKLLIDMHEGAGNIAHDISGEGNDGTLSQSNGVLPQWVTGRVTHGLEFDGVGAYVDCGDLGNLYDKGTIAFWMNTARLRNFDNPFTTRFEDGNAGIRFELKVNGEFIVFIGNDGGDFTIHSYLGVGGLTVGMWCYIVLVWDVTNDWTIGYLNSIEKFNEAHTKWATTMPQIAIGNGFSNTRYFKGTIDEVRIYNRALTIHEIKMHYIARA